VATSDHGALLEEVIGVVILLFGPFEQGKRNTASFKNDNRPELYSQLWGDHPMGNRRSHD